MADVPGDSSVGGERSPGKGAEIPFPGFFFLSLDFFKKNVRGRTQAWHSAANEWLWLAVWRERA